MKKVILTFAVDNVIDLITNSSSELFVLEGQTTDIVEEMVRSVHPTYEREYDKPINSRLMTADSLDYYFSFACSSGCYPARKDNYPVLPGFTFDELYEPENGDPAWNGEIQYQLRNNIKNPKSSWDRAFVTEENFDEIVKKLDPDGKLYFLFSLDENPDWDMQEKLMQIGVRYHLG